MTATVADEHLIALVAGGDPDAVGGLYDRHAAVLLAVAFRILGSRADAEDVVHDAFASLPDRSRHYAVERGSVAAWLIILVRNLCLDRLRRRGVRAALVRESPQVLHPPPAGDPELAADTARRVERVRAALESLPPVQQNTLRTAFFEGLSYSEIAAREGISLGTVKSRAARALAALREALAAEGIQPFPG
jgi:RNA polymerase sigma-70 factor (ECF subfamily)